MTQSLGDQNSNGFGSALEAAVQGNVTPEIARRLIRARDGEELGQLLRAAAVLRDAIKGTSVSFSKKVFIPLTNLCRDYCGYCTFRKDPGEAGAHTMTPDEVLRVAKAGSRL